MFNLDYPTTLLHNAGLTTLNFARIRGGRIILHSPATGRMVHLGGDIKISTQPSRKQSTNVQNILQSFVAKHRGLLDNLHLVLSAMGKPPTARNIAKEASTEEVLVSASFGSFYTRHNVEVEGVTYTYTLSVSHTTATRDLPIRIHLPQFPFAHIYEIMLDAKANIDTSVLISVRDKQVSINNHRAAVTAAIEPLIDSQANSGRGLL